MAAIYATRDCQVDWSVLRDAAFLVEYLTVRVSPALHLNNSMTVALNESKKRATYKTRSKNAAPLIVFQDPFVIFKVDPAALSAYVTPIVASLFVGLRA